MLGLVRMVPKEAEPPRRLWLVFFGEASGAAWWTRVLRPGFRHVSAAAFYAAEQRWVYFNPTIRGIVIEVKQGADFTPRLEELLSASAAVLRVPSRHDRTAMPAAIGCVGAVKALLGIRARALTPWGLFRHLRANGAEPVEVPGRGRDFFTPRSPEASARERRDAAPARAGAGAG